MAEFVQRRSEDWIPDLETMKSVGLLSDSDIQILATKRRNYEYRLVSKTSKKADYLEYIYFEADFYRLIRERRKEDDNSGLKDVEFRQANRVIKIYKLVLILHGDDLAIWFSLFSFCKHCRQKEIVSNFIVQLLKRHVGVEELYKFAASFDEVENGSFELARKMLLKGLQNIPNSRMLHEELFMLEVRYLRLMLTLKNEPQDVVDSTLNLEEIYKGRLVEVAYKAAVEKFQSTELKVKLFNAAKEFAGIPCLKMILNDLFENGLNDSITWDLLARLMYSGVEIPVNLSLLGGISSEVEVIDICSSDDEETPSKQKNMRKCIVDTVNVYNTGLMRLKNEAMWEKYITFLQEIYKEKCYANLKANLLWKALMSCNEEGFLTDKQVLYLCETKSLTSKEPEKMAQVLESATVKYPRSVEVWFARLRHHATYDQKKLVLKVFNEAIKKLFREDSSKMMPFWRMMLMYLSLKPNAVYQDFCLKGIASQKGEVALMLKLQYLDWVLLHNGISETRKLFESEQFKHPLSLELLLKMAQLESIQPNPAISTVHSYYQLGCSHFGKDSPDVWIKYIEFATKLGELHKAQQICDQAVITLRSPKRQEFIDYITKIKAQQEEDSSSEEDDASDLLNESKDMVTRETPYVEMDDIETEED